MKLLSQKFEKDGEGDVGLIPEDDEDLWHLYNIVLPGDTIRTATMRKVQKESATGSSIGSQKMKLVLTVRIKAVDFDPLIGELRFAGRNESESEHVKMGAHHTCEVMKGQKITVAKRCWDDIFLRRIAEACDPSQKADLAAVVLQEGLAHICLVTPSMTVLKHKVDMPIPRKRRCGATQHDKSMVRFYDQVFQGVMRHIKWDIVKCFLVCSPGFLREDFLKYCFAEAVKRDTMKEAKELVQSRPKWVLAQCSSGHLHALKEVLADPAHRQRLSDTKAHAEVRVMEEFLLLLKDDEDRVVYGPLPILKAAEKGAIRKLMILDDVFRPQNIGKRRQWVKLVEDVEGVNGEVRVFSSMHVTGEWLKSLCGVAAILSYPCPELADLDSEEEGEEGGGDEDDPGEAAGFGDGDDDAYM